MTRMCSRCGTQPAEVTHVCPGLSTSSSQPTSYLVEGSLSDTWTQGAVYEFVAALQAELDAALKGAMSWESAASRALDRAKEAERQRDELVKTLREIAGRDYRGNRTADQQIAWAALALYEKEAGA